MADLPDWAKLSFAELVRRVRDGSAPQVFVATTGTGSYAVPRGAKVIDMHTFGSGGGSGSGRRGAAGSVRSASFPDIYRDAELLRSLRDPDRLGGRCGRCEFRSVCGGSRSRAYAVTGDPLAEDPGCNYQPQGSAVSQGS